MSRILKIFQSSIGCKAIMAVTGLLLIGFVIAHLAGNLLIFGGADAINTYAARLKALGPGLWVMRGGLLAIFLIHIFAGLRLTSLNRQARPTPYAYEDTRQASFASRTMLPSGLLILAFVVWHLAHFTLHWVQDSHKLETTASGVERHDVHQMVIEGFRNPGIAISYVVAMLVLGLHLWHGFPSLFQSLGLKHPAWQGEINCCAKAVALVIIVLNCAIPLVILLRLYPHS